MIVYAAWTRVVREYLWGAVWPSIAVVVYDKDQ